MTSFSVGVGGGRLVLQCLFSSLCRDIIYTVDDLSLLFAGGINLGSVSKTCCGFLVEAYNVMCYYNLFL